MTKEYRSHNKIFERLAGTPERVIASIAETSDPAVLVCVNDFIGSGASAAEGILERYCHSLTLKSPTGVSVSSLRMHQ